MISPTTARRAGRRPLARGSAARRRCCSRGRRLINFLGTEGRGGDHGSSTQATPDEAAIVEAVLDYFEGWFDGDAAAMERALHPGLAKRALED